MTHGKKSIATHHAEHSARCQRLVAAASGLLEWIDGDVREPNALHLIRALRVAVDEVREGAG